MGHNTAPESAAPSCRPEPWRGTVRATMTRPALLLLVLSLLPAAAPATAAAGTCRKSCATLQANCLDAARGVLSTARVACAGERPCRREALRAFRGERSTCRKARTQCRPCCALGGVNECARRAGAVLPAEPQAAGDPVRGRDLLLGGDYMTCGVPYKVWSLGKDLVAGGYGGSADAPRIADRPGRNADMPYFLNVFTAPDGTEVVNGNCLMCHGGMIDGQLVVGLGNATADFTAGAGGGATSVPLTDALLDVLGLDDAERAQLQKIGARGRALGPLTHMRTVGMNPAELFAVILMVHHDRDTLAWSDTPYTPLVARDENGNVIDYPQLTSDPPPWWRAHKKNALFYNGMARGDHRGTMALATSVCVDDVERARLVDDQFRDIQAFVNSVRAPAWPRSLDQELVAKGKPIFERDCAGCHGTYGAREEDDTYPNLLIPLDVVGTDPAVANAGVVTLTAAGGLVQRLLLRRHHPHGAERSVPGVHAAAARRHLGDGAVSPQRLGADRRAGAQQPRPAAALAAGRSRQPQPRRERARLAVDTGRRAAGPGAGGGAQVRLRHDVLEPVEQRASVRRPPDGRRTARGHRVPEDAVTRPAQGSFSRRWNPPRRVSAGRSDRYAGARARIAPAVVVAPAIPALQGRCAWRSDAVAGAGAAVVVAVGAVRADRLPEDGRVEPGGRDRGAEQTCLRKVGAVEARDRDRGVREKGVRQVGPVQACHRELRAAKVGAGQIRVVEASYMHLGSLEIGAAQVGVVQPGTIERSAGQLRPNQLGRVQIGVVQDRSGQVRSAQIRGLEHGARQVAASEVRILHLADPARPEWVAPYVAVGEAASLASHGRQQEHGDEGNERSDLHGVSTLLFA